jgi:hypothetical protein
MEKEVLYLNRFHANENVTIGILEMDNNKNSYFTLEPSLFDKPNQKSKLIPENIYTIDFKKELTPLTVKYRKKYDFFKWHLQILNIPNRDNIYLHIGNFEKDTDGCILLNKTLNSFSLNRAFDSLEAYKDFYLKCKNILESGKLLAIEIVESFSIL